MFTLHPTRIVDRTLPSGALVHTRLWPKIAPRPRWGSSVRARYAEVERGLQQVVVGVGHVGVRTS